MDGMTVKVRDLQPGDVFLMDGIGGRGTVIVVTPHPLYTSPLGGNTPMQLVVWYLHDEGRFSFDALSSMQELPGTVLESNPRQRKEALRYALHEGQQ